MVASMESKNKINTFYVSYSMSHSIVQNRATYVKDT